MSDSILCFLAHVLLASRIKQAKVSGTTLMSCSPNDRTTLAFCCCRPTIVVGERLRTSHPARQTYRICSEEQAGSKANQLSRARTEDSFFFHGGFSALRNTCVSCPFKPSL